MPDDSGTNEGGAPATAPTPRATQDLDWRARALAAESAVAELTSKLASLEKESAQLRASLAAGDRKRELDRLLIGAGVIDADAAALLAEAAMSARTGADPAWAVAELRRSKPYLFSQGTTRPRAGAMSEAIEPSSDAALAKAAEEARSAGDRAAILRYLRLKRAS